MALCPRFQSSKLVFTKRQCSAFGGTPEIRLNFYLRPTFLCHSALSLLLSADPNFNLWHPPLLLPLFQQACLF